MANDRDGDAWSAPLKWTRLIEMASQRVSSAKFNLLPASVGGHFFFPAEGRGSILVSPLCENVIESVAS